MSIKIPECFGKGLPEEYRSNCWECYYRVNCVAKCRLQPEAEVFVPPMQTESAFATQVAGLHYKDLAIQPAEYCHRNHVGKLEGDVIYYVTRWRGKNGVEDLQKARHTLDLLIELETKHGS